MKIKFLKAFNGDSILLSFPDEKGSNVNILIDGGIVATYRRNKGPKGKPIEGELKAVIDNIRIKNEQIDLLIITHIDDDHISGILKWFCEDKDAHKLIKEIWFNSGSLISELEHGKENENLKHFINFETTLGTSFNQGKEFSDYIFEKGIWNKNIIIQNATIRKFGLEFKILSPDRNKLEILLKEWKKVDPRLDTSATLDDYSISLKEHLKNDVFEEDTSIPNGSSIAFILTCQSGNYLFLGDSHPSVVVKGLEYFGYSQTEPLDAKLVKLSHHGSKGNTNLELLKMINCDNYVISTNGRIHEHPHKKLLAILINQKKNCKIYFNYEERMKMIFSSQDKIDFPDFQEIIISKELEF